MKKSNLYPNMVTLTAEGILYKVINDEKEGMILKHSENNWFRFNDYTENLDTISEDDEYDIVAIFVPDPKLTENLEDLSFDLVGESLIWER